jgi:hypothetical protein
MHNSEIELLPAECGRDLALRIYFFRFFTLLTITAIAFIPLLLFSLYLLERYLADSYLENFLWVSAILYAIGASGLGYILWIFRGTEDVLRDYAVIDLMLDDISKQLDILATHVEALESLEKQYRQSGKDITVLAEEAITHTLLTSQVGEQMKELRDRVRALRKRLRPFGIQSSAAMQRIDNLNQRLHAMQAAFPRIERAAQGLRERLASH